MAVTVEDTIIVQKTKELCQSILDHPDFQNVRKNIDLFLADEKAKDAYQALIERGEELHHKQHQGVKLSEQEVDAYQKQREGVVNNPLTANFLRAQQEVNGIQESINKYLSKTFELGRVPEAGEMEEGGGSCGSGCGCH
jgi:cell fate (sporulation/competence/biofilm development) regulator YlbF (YheA/YmcA/DUF963 family)